MIGLRAAIAEHGQGEMRTNGYDPSSEPICARRTAMSDIVDNKSKHALCGTDARIGSAVSCNLDLKRFAKLCDQLNSSHPTEREVAAAKASAMLAAADLTWSDIIFGGTSAPAPRMAELHGIKASVFIPLIAAKRNKLGHWETEFIRCLTKQGKRVTLSRKQWASLMVIAVKCGAIMDFAKLMGDAVEGR
jgi:hypothetical protein